MFGTSGMVKSVNNESRDKSAVWNAERPSVALRSVYSTK